MVRLYGTKVLRFVLLSLLVLTMLPLATGAQTGTSETVSPAEEVDEYDYAHSIYMPLMYKNGRHTELEAPDLVVDSITVNTDSAVVVISNQGNADVTSDDAFWVDLYIDPERMPTGVNEVWYDLGDQGIVWGIANTDVLTDVLPLEPGETLTLVYCPDQPGVQLSPVAEYTIFDGDLAPGTPIAVQVDSANLDDPEYGGVKEDHEILGLAYNNIEFTLSIAGSGCGGSASASASDIGQPGTLSDRLPSRSRNPK